MTAVKQLQIANCKLQIGKTAETASAAQFPIFNFKFSIFSSRRGAAYVLAVILLALFASLAAAMAAATNSNVRLSKNLTDVMRARLAAESGLSFAIRQVSALSLPSSTTTANVIANLAVALGARLNGTANLAGALVASGASVVNVPSIATDDGVFTLSIVQNADGTLTLRSLGLCHNFRRTVAMDLALSPGHPNSAFNYGIASRGVISIGGSAQIRGKTDASIVSTAAGPMTVTVSGNAVIDGDISSVGPQTTVVIEGSPTIAGSQDPNVIATHVHFGVEPPAFPEVDTSIFSSLTTTVIDTNTGWHNPEYNNVLIKAGTNPNFSGDVTLNGVVFIEVPNNVSFTSKVTLNGLVATEQKAGASIDTCKLSFGGQVEAFGVEALTGSEFDAVKALTGTFIVAPGFDVSFAGQFTTINGTIAADRLTFSGQASGTVKGSVVGLADNPSSILGTVDIYIDRSGSSGGSAGFVIPMSLRVQPGTYKEITGS